LYVVISTTTVALIVLTATVAASSCGWKGLMPEQVRKKLRLLYMSDPGLNSPMRLAAGAMQKSEKNITPAIITHAKRVVARMRMPARKLAKRITSGDLHKIPNAKSPQTTATAQNSQTKLHVFSTLLEASLEVASFPQCTTGAAKLARPLIADVMTAA
jgi:hypothetical protein